VIMFATMLPPASTPRIRSHVFVPGSMRNRPCEVAANTRWSTGSTTIRQIRAPFSAFPPIRVQVEPPSVDRSTPTPAYASLEVFASPVPTYTA
jgi:hypothetical protein